MKNKEPRAFNNSIEYGLRAIILMLESYPEMIDLERLVYLDYILVHSGDFNSNLRSLHAPTPYRKDEIYVKRNLFQSGLVLFAKCGLVNIDYRESGISYEVTENSSPYIDTLSEEYTILLRERAEWLSSEYIYYSAKELLTLIKSTNKSKDNEIAFDVNLIGIR